MLGQSSGCPAKKKGEAILSLSGKEERSGQGKVSLTLQPGGCACCPQEDLRVDGRGCEDYRCVQVETDVVSNTSGSARVKLVSAGTTVPAQAKPVHTHCGLWNTTFPWGNPKPKPSSGGKRGPIQNRRSQHLLGSHLPSPSTAPRGTCPDGAGGGDWVPSCLPGVRTLLVCACRVTQTSWWE